MYGQRAADSLLGGDDEASRRAILLEGDGPIAWDTIGTVGSPANEAAALSRLAQLLKSTLPALADADSLADEDSVLFIT